ncbi:lipocalin family protein, partial [Scytonema sp. PCC 10023]|uniref:lipocalin family protein n=1 Tax=Scytonema sp. PCC 10023 TaxID=1680591 RepID=UPI0039C71666
MVGEPSGRYLWLMSRMAKPPQEARTTILNRTAELGYDLALFLSNPASSVNLLAAVVRSGRQSTAASHRASRIPRGSACS